MRWSQSLIPTQKESPADAVAPSHILLLRAGMIRSLGSGAYTYMPLGLRVLNKAAQIVREEMDAAGAVELLMPALHPIELWQESGRHTRMGGILMEFKLNERTHVTLGPTHEEVITDIVRDLVNSYRQLPLTLYQIQTKFRNEPRPRFGILRTREFLMKDAYSFGADLAQLNASYDSMYEAYCRVFDRCELPYVSVEAESGPIGGDVSHEFMVPCATGEDSVILCPSCGYAANRERAEIGPETQSPPPPTQDIPSASPVDTPGKRTIQEISDFLRVSPSQTAKLLVYLADDQPVAALLRGDHELNESKLSRVLGCTILTQADADQIERSTGIPMGFLGPVNCKIPLVVDRAVAAMPSAVVGGNALDVHLRNVVPGRDFPIENLHDLRSAQAQDPCPRCGSPLQENQGIEIGHVFKLGTKYSKAMGARYLDEKGQSHDLIMGCYGIGVNRILAAAVEAFHDSNGIRWPLNIAPYQVLVVPLQVNNDAVNQAAEKIAADLEKAGIDVLIDDRDLRPGVKFKDADLVGIPLRVVIGERGLKDHVIEYKWRDQEKPATFPLPSAGADLLAILQERKAVLESACLDRRVARATKRGILIADA